MEKRLGIVFKFNSLHDQRRHDHGAQRRQHGVAVAPALDDPGAGEQLDNDEDEVERDEDGGNGPELALDECLALAHGLEALEVLECGDDAVKVPDDAELDEADRVGNSDEKGEEPRDGCRFSFSFSKKVKP
jgi:hypothetical protein